MTPCYTGLSRVWTLSISGRAAAAPSASWPPWRRCIWGLPWSRGDRGWMFGGVARVLQHRKGCAWSMLVGREGSVDVWGLELARIVLWWSRYQMGGGIALLAGSFTWVLGRELCEAVDEARPPHREARISVSSSTVWRECSADAPLAQGDRRLCVFLEVDFSWWSSRGLLRLAAGHGFRRGPALAMTARFEAGPFASSPSLYRWCRVLLRAFVRVRCLWWWCSLRRVM
jgi:hypothetical protein